MIPDVFRDVPNKFVLVFVHDIFVFSKSEKEHESHLGSALETLRSHQLKAKFSKCHFWRVELRFLGHIASESGVSVDPVKAAAINVSLFTFLFLKFNYLTFFGLIHLIRFQDWETLNTPFHIRNFLGLIGYYRRFIENSARIAASLTALTCKNE